MKQKGSAGGRDERSGFRLGCTFENQQLAESRGSSLRNGVASGEGGMHDDAGSLTLASRCGERRAIARYREELQLKCRATADAVPAIGCVTELDGASVRLAD